MLPSAISPKKATIVSEKVGKAKLTGMRPAISQMPAKSAIETRRRRIGRSCHPAASPRPESGAKPTASPSVLMLLAIRPRLFLAELGDGAVDRGRIPEVLDLEGGGIAFDLAGSGEERE